MNKSARLLLCALIGAGVLAGCSSPDPKADTSISSSTEAQAVLVLGTENENNQKVTLTNSTGSDIEKVTLQSAALSSMPSNLLLDGALWKQGGKADLYIEKTDADVPLVFRIDLKEGDGVKTMQITEFPVDQLGSSAQLKIENGELVLMQGGQIIGSNQSSSSEQTSLEHAPAAENPSAPAEENPQNQPDIPAADSPVYEPPVYQEPVYEEVPPASSEGPVYQEPVYQEPVYEQDPVDYVEVPQTPEPVEPPVQQEPVEIPSQNGGENCINPGDIILNPNA